MSYPKPVIRVLEKCFADEMYDRLPTQFGHGKHSIGSLQVGSAVVRAYNAGLIRPLDHQMTFNDGLPPMMIQGFVLTVKGHLVYCEWAAKQPLPPDAPS